MTREDALVGLESDDNDIRLRAARFFSSNATAEDLELLRNLDDAETVPWIKRALRIACERISGQPLPAADTPESDGDDEVGSNAYAKAMRDVSERILHEFGPLIGGLQLSAPKEVPDYEQSMTRRLLDQLKDRADALLKLRTATATSRFVEFKLATLIETLIHDEFNPQGVEVIATGPEGLIVSADKGQLALAFSNGLRNALEAVEGRAEPKPQIVVSWGETGQENWIFVKDNGPGLKREVEELLRQGTSSKTGHSGYGLALVKEAMTSMEGEVMLKNYEDGAHFELRWFRKNENIVR